MKKAIFLAGLALTIGSAAAAQTPTIAPALAGTRLELVARGEVRRVPDIAVITAGVVTQSRDASSAMRENATRMARVIAALKNAGIAERDIATASVNLSPQYRYVENQAPVITGYQASNQLSIRFRDIARSGTILDTLVTEGANQIAGPNLQIDKPQTAFDEARVSAVRQARSRAELYAGAAGLRIKRIVSITEQEGYAPPPMPMMQMARGESADAKTEVLAGEQTLSVALNVVFELE
jgi:uncharacterized protein